MKIPLNWLNEFIQIPGDVKSLTDKLTLVGHMLDKIEDKGGETVIDLELRGNRADCYNILGIAREVGAVTGKKVRDLKTIPLKTSKTVKIPALSVKTDLVKRVGMIAIKNVKIVKSPKWLSERLAQYGMESKNNIVDLTNYVMIETGEPMHAFDLDTLEDSLSIRLAKSGEKLTTFQDKDITLDSEDLVWAMGGTILSVAGAVGEKHHSVSDNTKNILLEAANYERSNIRRTVYRHNLLTEAGIRHEKELDPNLVETAIGRFLYLLKENGWGEFENVFHDYYPKKYTPRKFQLTYSYLNSLSGVEFKEKEVLKILTDLGFSIISKTKDRILVEVPTYRTDVTLEEDLIEEITRIYGYEKIPVKTLSLPIPENVTPDFISQENILRNSAVSVGFDEMITMSFVKEKYAGNEMVSLQNPPSPDLKHLRDSLCYNLAEAGKRILDERGNLVQLFEIGKVYKKINNKYKEERSIAFLFHKKSDGRFNDFKRIIEAFFAKAGIQLPSFLPEPVNLNLEYSFKIALAGKNIGFGGSFEGFHYLEINLDSILGASEKYKVLLWPKYPPQLEDITLNIPDKVYVGLVSKEIASVSKTIKKVELIDQFNNSYTFNIEYLHPSKTLTDSEVEEIRKDFLAKIKTKFGVSLQG
jgi:phenylalanyl-tRNA synthetase beta chain